MELAFGVLLLLILAVSVFAQPEEWLDKIRSYDWLYSFTQEEEWYSPAIGNGYIATVIFSPSIYIAGVYNGLLVDEDKPSHRARVPSTVNIAVSTIDGNTPEKMDCALDLENGRYIQRYDHTIEQTIYAHRGLPHLLVHELRTLKNTHQVCILSDPRDTSADINFTQVAKEGTRAIYQGWTQETEWPEEPIIPVVVATYEPEGQNQTKMGNIGSWEKCFNISNPDNPLVFYTIIKDSATVNEAKQLYDEAVKKGSKELMHDHISEWQKLRQSGASIHIRGYPELARSVNASVYDLLVSMREDVEWSNSPGGLATNHYNGHVFWDYETWMYPTLLLMYPKLAQSGLQYRVNHLLGARKKAHDNKYLGAMWPWESARTGDETTPTSADTGKMEHHISGDIVFAAQQYDYLHRDPKLRESSWCPLAIETAHYWASRVEKDAFGAYHIIGVIPPDEYVENVTDSIYTNVVAGISLRYANSCSPNDTWVEIAEKLHIEYDPKGDWHPEYVGYPVGRIVKQADTTLTSFPLGQPYNHSTALNDLMYYETVTDRDGPAMSWSMFFVAYLDLTSYEAELAEAAFKFFFKSFLMNIKGPYLVWWESPSGGATHFATGAGGFLQGLLYGYGGIRIYYDPRKPEVLLRLKPFLPIAPIEQLELRGLNILGGKVVLDLLLDRTASATYVRTYQTGIYLRQGDSVRVDLTPGDWVQLQSNVGLNDTQGFYIVSHSPYLQVGSAIVILLLLSLLI